MQSSTYLISNESLHKSWSLTSISRCQERTMENSENALTKEDIENIVRLGEKAKGYLETIEKGVEEDVQKEGKERETEESKDRETEKAEETKTTEISE